MDAATNVTMEDTKEKIQTLIETSIIKKRQIKQGLDLYFITKDQLDAYSKIVSTTVSPNTPQENCFSGSLSGNVKS